MINNTQSYSNFSEFAREFRQTNPEILTRWKDNTDPLKRAVARIILEAEEVIG